MTDRIQFRANFRQVFTQAIKAIEHIFVNDMVLEACFHLLMRERLDKEAAHFIHGKACLAEQCRKGCTIKNTMLLVCLVTLRHHMRIGNIS